MWLGDGGIDQKRGEELEVAGLKMLIFYLGVMRMELDVVETKLERQDCDGLDM